MQYLKGKHFLNEFEDGFRFGKIVEADEEYIVVKNFTPGDVPDTGMFIYSLFQITQELIGDEHSIPAWRFFDTEQELMTYIAWKGEIEANMDDDENGVVVPIRGN
jgi:hypothetical protein